MTVTVKVKKNTKVIEDYCFAIRKLEKETVEVGYFAEQGVHYSGFTYAQLADILHNGRRQQGDGWAVDIIPRPFISIGIRTLKDTLLRSRSTKKKFRDWAKNPRNIKHRKEFLGAVGNLVSQSTKRVMGNPNMIMSNRRTTILRKGANTPLVDTGDFKRKLAYRTSLDKTLRKSRGLKW